MPISSWRGCQKDVAVLGLTFKPNTDDMREAPSLVIVPALMAQGAHVRAYDPHGMAEARRLIAGLETAAEPYGCIADADAMVILTEWDEFRALDLDRVKAALKSPIVVDMRNIYRADDMAAKGFQYFGVGQGQTSEQSAVDLQRKSPKSDNPSGLRRSD